MYILVASLQMKSGLSVYAAKFRRRQGRQYNVIFSLSYNGLQFAVPECIPGTRLLPRTALANVSKPGSSFTNKSTPHSMHSSTISL